MHARVKNVGSGKRSQLASISDKALLGASFLLDLGNTAVLQEKRGKRHGKDTGL